MTDTVTIAGMRDRVSQLHHIAGMTGSQEIRDLLFKVAGEIEAEIKRLETAEAAPDLRMSMPPQG